MSCGGHELRGSSGSSFFFFAAAVGCPPTIRRGKKERKKNQFYETRMGCKKEKKASAYIGRRAASSPLEFLFFSEVG
jgi:methionine salvage enolase-phosphatase E1